MSEAIYFISDAHLKPLDAPGERAKQAHLISFIKSLHGRAKALFVVGDLFDFWFEYQSAVPARGGRVLSSLSELVNAGTRVTVMGGNHDWWIGRSLEREYDLTIHHGPLRLHEQGRLLHIEHGDGLSVLSRRYNLVRRILHHPIPIRLFSTIHPTVANWLSTWIADGSRALDYAETPEMQLQPKYVDVMQRLSQEGVDIGIFGHIHMARIETVGDAILAVLGDWSFLGTYAELRGGQVRILTWRNPDLPDWP
jgi:UDP-2,3-diacylglucosamine hydrolase